MKEIEKVNDKILEIIANMRWSMNISGILDALEFGKYPERLIEDPKHGGRQLYKTNYNFINDILKEKKQAIEKIYIKSNKRRKMFKKIREKMPEFCNDIENFLSEEEKSIYEEGIRKLLFYLKYKLNIREGYMDNEPYREQYRENLYDISQMTDSPYWNRLGNIQDRYVAKQLAQLNINEFSEEDQETILGIKQEVQEHIDGYNRFVYEMEKHTGNITVRHENYEDDEYR